MPVDPNRQISKGTVRVSMWVIVGGLIVVSGLLAGPTAWAQTVICSGGSSVPIAPTLLNLVKGGQATYEVSLCSTPTGPVTVTPLASPTGKVGLSPNNLVFTSKESQTISVTVDIAETTPFTVEILHSVASTDPDYNYGQVNVPTVIAVYNPPLAVNDAAGTLQGNATTISVLDNDIDRSKTGLTLLGISDGANGQTAAVGAEAVYTPNLGFAGVDQFLYTVQDAIGNRDVGFVTVLVSPSSNTDSAPEVFQIDSTVPTNLNFASENLAVEINLPAGFFAGTVNPKDNLSLVFTEITTPTADIENPPLGLGYVGPIFTVTFFLNGQPIQQSQLVKPITLSLELGPAGQSLAPDLVILFWTGTQWSNAGVSIVSQDPSAGTITFMTGLLNVQYGVFDTGLRVHLPILAR